MQNPADPDATYRKKAGTEYRGYIANVVEVADHDHNSITVDYQYEKNTYSDSQFLKDYMEQQPGGWITCHTHNRWWILWNGKQSVG